jgi:hypothetical protein
MRRPNWPTVIVAAIAVAALGTLAVWGKQWGLDADAHRELLTFLGALGMIVLAYMRQALLEGDDD